MAGAALALALSQILLGAPRATLIQDRTTPTCEYRIDPNIASRSELMLLPRIGPALADYIIEFRESRAPQRAFARAEDLDLVYRIGPTTVENLRPYLRFDSAEHPASPEGKDP